MKKIQILAACVVVCLSSGAGAQDEVMQILSKPDRNMKDPAVRAQVVRELQQAEAREWAKTKAKAKQLGLQLREDLPGGGVRGLERFDGDEPIYIQTCNDNSAITSGANLIRDFSPYNLDGSGLTVGVWDGGSVLSTHQEFNEGASSRITVGDGTASNYHATHVGGTIAAHGTVLRAKGMAPAAEILSYDFISTYTQRLEAAATGTDQQATNIYLSNHSYELTTGWYANKWYGSGTDQNAREYGFGQYSSSCRSVDVLHHDAPYYLEFWAAGNSRTDNPSTGATVTIGVSTYSYDPSIHPPGDGKYLNGFGCIGEYQSAKNIVTVGNVTTAANAGVRDVSLPTIASSSSWGPTDDGRIKPDLVAQGTNVYSTDNGNNTDYRSMTGTSMASPGACGSAALLVDQYKRLFNSAMRGSTLKGLLIHTTDDLGNAGPDYKFGWGLINVKRAADLVQSHADNPDLGRLHEGQLNGSSPSYTKTFEWDGVSPIRATLCWTDPEGASTTLNDSRTARLVNDLDLKIIAPDNTEHFPFVMPYVGDWTTATLNSPATTGVNTVDPVEQVLISAPAQTGIWQVQVTYTGTLSGTLQDFGLLLSGLADQIPPSLAPTDIVDDRNGNDMLKNTLVTYTLSFSEDIDDTTVSAADFANAGTASITIGNITETATGVFSVEVTPTSAGSLQLSIAAGAVITDIGGNELDTTSAIADDTTITVIENNTPPVVDAGSGQSLVLSNTGLWTPSEISTSLWLDASDASTLTESGGEVSQWNDKSGNSNHATQGTSSLRPDVGTGAQAIHGLNTLRSQASVGEYMNLTDTIALTDYSTFSVLKADSDPVDFSTRMGVLASSDNAWDDYTMNFMEPSGGFIRVNTEDDVGTVGSATFGACTTLTTPFLYSNVRNQSGAVNTYHYNGDGGTLSTSMSGNLNLNTVFRGYAGAIGSNGQPWDGSVGEVIVIDTALSPTERQRIEGYLAHKWGLQADLPSGHPYQAIEPFLYSGVASLNASASDADGHALSYTWSMLSGPGTVVFANASAIDSTATFSAPGTYVLRLSVYDGFETSFDDVTITVTEPRTLTYDANGATVGSAPVDPSNPYANGSTVTILGVGNLEWPQHTFSGWNTAADGTGTSYIAGNTFSISSNITLYAQWTPESYTVSFDANGGGTPSATNTTVTYNSTYGTLATISRSGYTFTGWYTAASGGSLVTSDTIVSATADHTLYAQWNGMPSVNLGDDQTVIMNTQVPWTPDVLSELAAWYDAADESTITKDASNQVSEWRDKSGNDYHVSQSTVTAKPLSGTRSLNNRNAVEFSQATTQSLTTNANVASQALTAFAVASFDAADSNMTVFDGTGTTRCLLRRRDTNNLGLYAGAWFDGAAMSSGAMMASTEFNGSNSTIRKDGGTAAIGNPGTGNLANGLTIGSTATPNALYGMDGLIGELIFVGGLLDGTEREKVEGYLARQWGLLSALPETHTYKSTDPTSIGAMLDSPAVVSDPESDPLTYSWSKISGPGTVTFSDAATVDSTASFGMAGTYVLRLTVSDGASNSFDDITITVSPALSVTYDANSATAGTAPVDASNPYADGDTVTVLGAGDLARTLYSFSGWNTAADGSGTGHQPAATFNISADTTLYAQWTADTYTATFNANGGTTPIPTSSTVTYGSAYGTLASCSRTGFNFTGWYTAPTGGTRVTEATMVSATADHTLYAQWSTELTIATTDGAGGVSGHVQYGVGGLFGTSRWLIKNDGATGNYTRKGYLRFDTTAIGATLTSASLELTVDEIDATIGGNNQTLYIYGITDEALDDVALTNALTWETAPANDTTSAYLADLTKATELGTIVLNATSAPVGTTVSLSSQALVDFLNADTNQKVTFIIGRLGTNDQLNLYFAGDTHATYAAPTLRLVGNAIPEWTSNPITKSDATEGAAYSASLAADASDADNDTLTFAKVSGPDWLSVALDGTLSGTPANADIGANAFTVSVTDSIIASPVESTLNITVIGFVPAYTGWANTHVDFTDPAPAVDFDGGGVDSGLEWIYGGDPTDAGDDAQIMPVIDDSDPAILKCTYRRSDTANADPNTTITVEYGSDLVGWTPAAHNGTTIIVTTVDDGAAPGVDLVEVAISRSLAVGNKMFTHIKVEVTP